MKTHSVTPIMDRNRVWSGRRERRREKMGQVLKSLVGQAQVFWFYPEENGIFNHCYTGEVGGIFHLLCFPHILFVLEDKQCLVNFVVQLSMII